MHSPTRRRGFTLAEVLVVVAIILVLVGLVTVGLNRYLRQGKVQMTDQLLANCRGWLAELDRADQLRRLPTAAVVSPGLVRQGAADRTGTVVTDTRTVMTQLAALPVNKQAMDQTPSEHRWLPANDWEGSIILDGWLNPIIFVPAGGLNGLTEGGTAMSQPLQSPDRRPFFASAGPDEDFTTHEDNQYSFTR